MSYSSNTTPEDQRDRRYREPLDIEHWDQVEFDRHDDGSFRLTESLKTSTVYNIDGGRVRTQLHDGVAFRNPEWTSLSSTAVEDLIGRELLPHPLGWREYGKEQN